MNETEKEKYAKYLCSPEWWAKRNAVMERSFGRCEDCGSEASHVHHLTYIRKYNERLEDLKALCESCHDAIHKAKLPKRNVKKVDSDEDRKMVEEFRRDCFLRRARGVGLENELQEVFEEERLAIENNGDVGLDWLGKFIDLTRRINGLERVL